MRTLLARISSKSSASLILRDSRPAWLPTVTMRTCVSSQRESWTPVQVLPSRRSTPLVQENGSTERSLVSWSVQVRAELYPVPTSDISSQSQTDTNHKYSGMHAWRSGSNDAQRCEGLIPCSIPIPKNWDSPLDLACHKHTQPRLNSLTTRPTHNLLSN